ncbi:MAG: glycosyltransferase family 4 protein [Chlorobi bacterium]|nr:glycosyltransferase family 4 protein [Chlorobiota bacterium]
MRKINLLFIIYDLDRGGPEMRLLDFARFFPQEIKINICVTSKSMALLNEFQKSDVDIKVLPIIKAYREKEKIYEIHDYIKKKRITVVNTFDIKGLMIAVFIKSFLNKKIKIIHHTVDLLHNYKIRHKASLWFLLKFVDLSICNSSHSKNILKGRFIGQHKIKVIYNGVDIEHYNQNNYKASSFKKKHNIDHDKIVLGTVANFRKEKNYPFLLKAFADLDKKHNNLVLLCVGGGRELDEMKEYAKEIGIEDKVIFTGYSEDVADYLGIMDFFLLCSLKEGFPNGIIQAMSMGIPVIASAVGGCNEIINDQETGMLFSPNNALEFEKCVSRLILDKDLSLRLGNNGQRNTRERFSMKTMIQSYLKSFEEIDGKV